MSDFQTLKNARKQRVGRASFVSHRATNDNGRLVPESKTEEQMEVDSSETAVEESSSAIPQPGGNSASLEVNTEGLFKNLPQTLEIRMTPETGRGLYSTANYKPGMHSNSDTIWRHG